MAGVGHNDSSSLLEPSMEASRVFTPSHEASVDVVHRSLIHQPTPSHWGTTDVGFAK